MWSRGTGLEKEPTVPVLERERKTAECIAVEGSISVVIGAAERDPTRETAAKRNEAKSGKSVVKRPKKRQQYGVMKIALVVAMAPGLAVAQFPTQVNVTVTQRPDYMRPLYESLAQGFAAAAQESAGGTRTTAC